MKVTRTPKRVSEMPESQQRAMFEILKSFEESREDFAKKLSAMDTWPSQKADLYHWVPLLDRFDGALESFVQQESGATEGESTSSRAIEVPVVLSILQFLTVLLENGVNKHIFNSLERLSALLEARNNAIVIATLRLLYALERKSARHESQGTINVRLLILALGWGRKDGGLSILSCSANTVTTKPGNCLHYEFYRVSDDVLGKKEDRYFFESNPGGQKKPSKSQDVEGEGVVTIHVDDVTSLGTDPHAIFVKLCSDYGVPDSHKFALLWRVKQAFSYSDNTLRIECVKLRTWAISVLFVAHPDDVISTFNLCEPDIASELVEIIKAKEEMISKDVQTLALRALGGMAIDRSRQSVVMSLTGALSHHGLLPTLIRQTVVDLGNTVYEDERLTRFAEALFQMLCNVVPSSSWCTALVSAGMVSSLIPMFSNPRPSHAPILALVGRVISCLLEENQTAGHQFRELGGSAVIIDRIENIVARCSTTSQRSTPERSSDSMNLSEKLGDALLMESTQKRRKVDGVTPIDHTQRKLLKSLLRVLMLTVTMPAAGNVRTRPLVEGSLPHSLKAIVSNSNAYGGMCFCLATSLMCDIVNQEPTCLPQLIATGLPEAFIRAVEREIPVELDVVRCIPEGLSCLCLNSEGINMVQESKALKSLFGIFRSKEHSRILVGDYATMLAQAVDEFMRHVPDLKEKTMDALVESINDMAKSGGGDKSDSVSDGRLIDQITCLGKFLGALLPHSSYWTAFIGHHGLVALLGLLRMDGLPLKFPRSSAATGIYQAFKSLRLTNLYTLARSLIRHIQEEVTTLLGLMEWECQPSCGTTEGVPRPVLNAVCKVDCLVGALVEILGVNHMTYGDFASPNSSETFRSLAQIRRHIWWKMAFVLDTAADGTPNLQTDSKAADKSSDKVSDEPVATSDDMDVDSKAAGSSMGTQTAAADDIFGKSGAAQLLQFVNVINSLFSRLSKVITGKSRGPPTQFKDNETIAKTIANSMIGNFEYGSQFMGSGMTHYMLYQGFVVHDTAEMLMFDTNINTLVLECFASSGGVKHIGDLIKRTVSELEMAEKGKEVSMSCTEPSGKRSVSVGTDSADLHTVLAEIGAVVQTLVSTRQIVSSPVSASMRTSYGPWQVSRVMNPHMLARCVQFSCREVLLDLWSNPIMSTFPTSLAEMVIRIVGELSRLPKSTDVANSEVDADNEDGATKESLVERYVSVLTRYACVSHDDAVKAVGDNPPENLGLVLDRLQGIPLTESTPEGETSAGPSDGMDVEKNPGKEKEADESAQPSELERALAVSLGQTLPSLGKKSESLEAREKAYMKVQEGIISRALELVVSTDGLTYSVSRILVDAAVNSWKYLCSELTRLIRQFCASPEEQGSKLHNITHLAALILERDNGLRTMFVESGIVADLLSLLQQVAQNSSKNPPKFTNPLLLVLDGLCKLNVKSFAAKSDSGDKTDPTAVVEPARPYIGIPEQKSLLQICTSMLRCKDSIQPSVFHACLLVLSKLVRSNEIAVAFMQEEGIDLLLDQPPRLRSNATVALYHIILRRIVEEPAVLLSAMEAEVRHAVLSMKSRGGSSGRVPLKSFMNSMSSVVARDPPTFYRAVANTCKIDFMANGNVISLLDKGKDQGSSGPDAKEKEKDAQKKKDRKGSATGPLYEVVTALITALIETCKVEFGSSLPQAKKKSKGKAKLNAISAADALMDLEKCNEAPKILQASNILQCLTEIVSYYSGSVSAILRYHPPGNLAGDLAGGDGENCGIIGYIIRKLLVKRPLNSNASSLEVKKSVGALSAGLLMSINGRFGEGRRRIVVELVSSLNEIVGDTFMTTNRMIAARIHVDFIYALMGLRNHPDRNQTSLSAFTIELGRTMIEKNVISALTSVLRNLDLHHPSAHALAVAVLKPLEILTKLSGPKIAAIIEKAAGVARTGGNDGERMNAVNMEGSADQLESLNYRLEGDILDDENQMEGVDDEDDESITSNEMTPHMMDDMINEMSEEMREEVDDDMDEDEDGDEEDDEGEDEDDEDDDDEDDDDDDDENRGDDYPPSLESDDEEYYDDWDPFVDPLSRLDHQDDEMVSAGGRPGRFEIQWFPHQRGNRDGPVGDSNDISRVVSHPLLSGMEPAQNASAPMPGGAMNMEEREFRNIELHRGGDMTTNDLRAFVYEMGGIGGRDMNIFIENSLNFHGLEDEGVRIISTRRDEPAASTPNSRWNTEGDQASALNAAAAGLENSLVSHVREVMRENESRENQRLEQERKEREEREAQQRAEEERKKAEEDARAEEERLVEDEARRAAEEARQAEEARLAEAETQRAAAAPGTEGSGAMEESAAVSGADGSDPMDVSVDRLPERSGEGQAAASEPTPGASSDAAPPLNLPPDIDPDVFASLPDEMKAEILAQSAPAAAPSTAAEGDNGPSNQDVINQSGIDPEVLAALPPEIQAEILEQTRREQEAVAAAAAPADPSNAEEMDIASFIASLDPELREDVLLSQDEAVLAQLPPEIAAEAQLLRERAMNQYRGHFQFGRAAPVQRAPVAPKENKEEPTEEDYPALMDEKSIRALIRVLQMPQAYSRHLQKVFLNLCNNPQTRNMVLIRLLQLVIPISSLEDNGDGPFAATAFGEATSQVVCRRVLELLQFLAKSSSKVAMTLFGFSPEKEAEEKKRLQAEKKKKEEEEAVKKAEKENDSATDKEKNETMEESPADQSNAKGKEEEKEKEKVPSPHCAFAKLIMLLSQSSYVFSISQVDQLLALLAVLVQSTGFSRRDKPSQLLRPENDKPQAMEISPSNLHLLVKVLTAETTGDSTFNRVTTVVQYLATSSSNKNVLIKELIDAAYGASVPVVQGLDRLAEDLSKTVMAHSSASFSTMSASYEELKLHRILRTITSLQGDNQSLADDQNFSRLWQALDTCLTSLGEHELETTNTLSPVMCRLLPSVEGLFVVLSPKKTETEPNENANTEGGVTPQSSMDVLPEPTEIAKSLSRSESIIQQGSFLVQFMARHRKLLNVFVRLNSALLESSFRALTIYPKHLDFDNKRSFFRKELRKKHEDQHFPGIRINVRRSHVFEDSYHQLRMRNLDEMRGRLHVEFRQEEGIDAGGVTREWFIELSREIFNPNYALFIESAVGGAFQPNQNSFVNPDHLSYFKFVGRVIGKAIYDGHLLEAYFTRSFYKHMLGLRVRPQDMEAVDLDLYKNLQWMLDNPIDDVLDLTFSSEFNNFGKLETVDLKPNGRNIAVTDENKKEYVQLLSEHRLTSSIKAQIEAFRQGFEELIPRDLVSIFNEHELELLICGLPELDMNDLQRHTEYTGYTPTSPQIQWFWQVVHNLDREEKARLVQFVTGTSRVPLDGFANLVGMNGPQKFQIHRAFGGDTRLPTAHTCFNQLDLPIYSSFEVLKEKLMLACTESNTGFGFG